MYDEDIQKVKKEHRNNEQIPDYCGITYSNTHRQKGDAGSGGPDEAPPTKHEVGKISAVSITGILIQLFTLKETINRSHI